MNVRNSKGNQTFALLKEPVHTQILLYSILLVWSLLGNVLVIAVVYYNQNLRTNMNYLIVNMAVSDLLIPLVAIPWRISSATNFQWLVDGPFGEALCKLVPFFSNISPFVSSISLVIIALQRFVAVVYPTRRQFLSRQTTWIAISFPWIVAMTLFSPYFYTYRLTNEYGYVRCAFIWSLGAHLIWIAIVLATQFAIPLNVITILYTIIVYTLNKSLVNVRGLVEKELIHSRRRRNRQIFSMLITIVVVFIICWCPFVIFVILYISAPTSFWTETTKKLTFVFAYMAYLLAAINPCFYFGKHLLHQMNRLIDDQIEILPKTQHLQHLTSIPLQSRMNVNTR